MEIGPPTGPDTYIAAPVAGEVTFNVDVTKSNVILPPPTQARFMVIAFV